MLIVGDVNMAIDYFGLRRAREGDEQLFNDVCLAYVCAKVATLQLACCRALTVSHFCPYLNKEEKTAFVSIFLSKIVDETNYHLLFKP